MLATIEGMLTELAPDLDLITESRRIAAALFTDRVNPTLLKQAALDELASLTAILRRLPRRLERITNAAEHGRFAVNVRLLADERGRATITGLLHQVLVAFLAGCHRDHGGVAAGGHRRSAGHAQDRLFQLMGYNLLVISFIPGLRVLAPVFRRGSG